jgi:hypothetical protein
VFAGLIFHGFCWIFKLKVMLAAETTASWELSRGRKGKHVESFRGRVVRFRNVCPGLWLGF